MRWTSTSIFHFSTGVCSWHVLPWFVCPCVWCGISPFFFFQCLVARFAMWNELIMCCGLSVDVRAGFSFSLLLFSCLLFFQFFLFFVLSHISYHFHTSSLLRSTGSSFSAPLPCCLCLPPCLCDIIRLFFFFCHPPPLSSFPRLFCHTCFLFLCCLRVMHSCICVLSWCCVIAIRPCRVDFLLLFTMIAFCEVWMLFFSFFVNHACVCEVCMPCSRPCSSLSPPFLPTLLAHLCICGVVVIRACVVCAALLPILVCLPMCEMRGWFFFFFSWLSTLPCFLCGCLFLSLCCFPSAALSYLFCCMCVISLKHILPCVVCGIVVLLALFCFAREEE